MYIGKVYRAILDRFARQHVSEADLLSKISKIKSSLAADLKSGKLGRPGPSAGQYSDARLAKNVLSTVLVSPGSVAGQSPADVADYYLSCGADGLTAQAYYEPRQHDFVLCPGYLLSVLNSGSLESLDFVVGHELMHASVRGSDYRQIDRNSAFISCVQGNFRDRFESVEHVREELGEPAQRRLDKLEKGLKAQPGDHAVELLDIERQRRIALEQVQEMLAQEADMAKAIGHAPSIAEMHSAELVPDQGGFRILLEELGQLGKDKRAIAVVGAFRGHCDNPVESAKRTKYGPLRDDALHPSDRFRIESFFDIPEARQMLGCKDPLAPQPWCSLGGRAALAASCRRDMGIASASACEGKLEKELKSAGCVVSSLDCGPFDGESVACTADSPNCQLATRDRASRKTACMDTEHPAKLVAPRPPLSAVCVDKPSAQAPAGSTGTAPAAAAGSAQPPQAP